MEILGLSMTPEHIIFIPSVLYLGMLIGIFIGQSFKINPEGPANPSSKDPSAESDSQK